MKKLNFVLTLLSIALINLGCLLSLNCERPTGEVVEQELEIASFSHIHLKNSANIYVEQGETQRITAKGTPNVLQLLNTKVKDNTWDVEFDKCIQSLKDFELHIVVPELKSIAVYGSGDVIADKNTFQTNNLELAIKGSGNIAMDVDVKSVSVSIMGSGDVRIKGKTKDQQIAISGSGDVNASGLKSDNCDVSIKGSGDVKVHVKEKLTAAISGSGDIKYKGKPENISTDIKGSGEVKPF
jgi:hypothetical protein